MIAITIKMASLVSDIKIKSHLNTERIKDPNDKYAARAGEENESELRQSVQNTWRALITLCRRFLPETDDTTGSDLFSTTLSETDQTLNFDVTSRRTSNIADALSQAIHEYLVSGTLRRFYVAVAMTDLAALYATGEKDATDEIVRLLYRKAAPKIEHVTPTPSNP